MILDAITSSPLNVFFTIALGIGLVYLFCRKPSSSSSSTSSSGRPFTHNLSSRSTIGLGAGIIDEELQRTIAQIERQERDMIRREQDEAYQQSLKADREKRLKKEEEIRNKEAIEKEEREKLARQEEMVKRLTTLRKEISDKLPERPKQGSDDNVKLVFKLPDGTRYKQEFRKQDKVKFLYWYVFSIEGAPLQFKMTTNFPKRDLPGRPPIPEDFDRKPLAGQQATNSTTIEPNCEQTLEEAGITETQIIFVYDLDA